MTSAEATPPATGVDFVYHGWQFTLSARHDASHTYRPKVIWRMHGDSQMVLPDASPRFATHAAAVAHAERNAVQWVRDHMGYGRADF